MLILYGSKKDGENNLYHLKYSDWNNIFAPKTGWLNQLCPKRLHWKSIQADGVSDKKLTRCIVTKLGHFISCINAPILLWNVKYSVLYFKDLLKFCTWQKLVIKILYMSPHFFSPRRGGLTGLVFCFCTLASYSRNGGYNDTKYVDRDRHQNYKHSEYEAGFLYIMAHKNIFTI